MSGHFSPDLEMATRLIHLGDQVSLHRKWRINLIFSFINMHAHKHTNLNVIRCYLNTTGLPQQAVLLATKCDLPTEGKTA